MKKNVGLTDKIIRLLIAAVLVVLFFTHTLTGIWGIVALAGAAVLALTAFISFCGLYTLFGISTCPAKRK